MWRFFTRIFSIVCVFAIQPDAGFSQTRPKVVVGYASMSTVATTLWVAQERGFFAKNGLDVQAIFIPGSPTLIASLNTGDVHFGYTAEQRPWAPRWAASISK
jgi:ABC-type nitrate/sulfonate/bicarbonate transport system substrate-binding protein